MSNYELQSHKKSDSIKWVIVFTLIVVLFAGMFVSFFRDFKEDKPAEETQTEQSAEVESAQFEDGFNEIIFKE